MSEQAIHIIRGPRRWMGLLAWLVVCFGAALPGAWFAPGAWYAGLNKPWWNPPSWLFGPVWSMLYMMMAVAAWLVWQRGGFAAQRRPLTWFIAQLALNAAWTPLFFGLHLPAIAFGDILLLWVTLAVTIGRFREVTSVAGWMLIPYLAWVSFAAALNFALWRLNA